MNHHTQKPRPRRRDAITGENTEVHMAGMLVLSRKIGDSIMVGDDVEITVLEIRSGQVKLGILAPRGVPVHRLEIWRRIITERQSEARSRGAAPPDPRSPHERDRGEAA